jgi:NAD(P)-dependent dehydrogenase (short-subunit alcohol dehydrogenase family)
MELRARAVVNIGSISGRSLIPRWRSTRIGRLCARSNSFDRRGSRTGHVLRGDLAGWITTAMVGAAIARSSDPVAAELDACARHPAGRFGKPQDVAAVAACLVSKEARFRRGPVFHRQWLTAQSLN